MAKKEKAKKPKKAVKKAKEVEKDNANPPIHMIPYYAWSNRGDNQTMILWIPDNAKLAEQNMNHIKRGSN